MYLHMARVIIEGEQFTIELMRARKKMQISNRQVWHIFWNSCFVVVVVVVVAMFIWGDWNSSIHRGSRGFLGEGDGENLQSNFYNEHSDLYGAESKLYTH